MKTKPAKRRGSARQVATRGKRPTSVASRIVHRLTEFTEALESDANIAQKFTCHKVALKLEPGSYAPQKVKKTRELLNLSQPLFAKFLGVAVQTVRAWEQGDNVPSDMACRFLDEINANPVYWQERLRKAAVSLQS